MNKKKKRKTMGCKLTFCKQFSLAKNRKTVRAKRKNKLEKKIHVGKYIPIGTYC